MTNLHVSKLDRKVIRLLSDDVANWRYLMPLYYTNSSRKMAVVKFGIYFNPIKLIAHVEINRIFILNEC